MKTATHFAVILIVMGGFSACSNQNTAGGNPRTATVTMSDGTRLSGTVTESSASQIKLAGTDDSSHTIPMSQVRSIEYGDGAPPAAATSAPGAAKPPRAHEEHYHPTPAVISTKTSVVPVNTQLSVRTEDTIDSATAAEGQLFAAEITQDVLDANGDVVIPDGSNAQILIKSASKGSRFHGASDLVLDLQSVSVGGTRYLIDTADVERKGSENVGVNKRTAVFTGAGAAVGAIIGAIAGGGKGAAIGAASGAGAGAIAQVATSGKSIKVPVETILIFKLDKPLKVVAK